MERKAGDCDFTVFGPRESLSLGVSSAVSNERATALLILASSGFNGEQGGAAASTQARSRRQRVSPAHRDFDERGVLRSTSSASSRSTAHSSASTALHREESLSERLVELGTMPGNDKYRADQVVAKEILGGMLNGIPCGAVRHESHRHVAAAVSVDDVEAINLNPKFLGDTNVVFLEDSVPFQMRGTKFLGVLGCDIGDQQYHRLKPAEAEYMTAGKQVGNVFLSVHGEFLFKHLIENMDRNHIMVLDNNVIGGMTGMQLTHQFRKFEGEYLESRGLSLIIKNRVPIIIFSAVSADEVPALKAKGKALGASDVIWKSGADMYQRLQASMEQHMQVRYPGFETE